ncbi:MAG: outer membrane protein assembly factor BamD [Acidobacteria bacterium]|nr:outer membrane protein assembly factor BamD [Acidobacteriota bacterium]MSO83401.1 outer membrane protein assembly factor BamD [Acidobacteriota bacterium]
MSGIRVVAALALVAALAGGCAAKMAALPAGTADADKFLFERGTAAAKERKWLNAREYLRNVVDNYPQSPFRPDAKLALGDTYIGEKTTESLLLGANEFREFLTFYPTHQRADYAQLQLARSFMSQMLAPERDQSSTKDAIKEIEIFLQRFPNSALMPEARTMEREARDRLSEANYRVGFYYYRVKWYPGAIDRFRDVLSTDPGYSNRDAVYYHLAESLYRTAKPESKAEALPYYERLLKEFEKSEYLELAQKRVAELKGGAPAGK